MRNRLLLALPAFLLALTAAPAAAAQTSLQLRWELVGDSLTGDWGASRAAFTLTNRGTKPLPASGWAIYYNALHGAHPGTVGAGFTIEDLLGDLAEKHLDLDALLRLVDPRIEWVAPPDAIARALFEPPRFERALPPYLRAGFPTAIGTRIEQTSDGMRWIIQLRGGEMRVNGMEPRTGDLVLELAESTSGRVRWRAVSDTSHMTHFPPREEVASSRGGKFGSSGRRGGSSTHKADCCWACRRTSISPGRAAQRR